ncbi:hypothetical protein BDW71DRAFT_184674 [Aspergillus fruticulosus]
MELLLVSLAYASYLQGCLTAVITIRRARHASLVAGHDLSPSPLTPSASNWLSCCSSWSEYGRRSTSKAARVPYNSFRLSASYFLAEQPVESWSGYLLELRPELMFVVSDLPHHP